MDYSGINDNNFLDNPTTYRVIALVSTRLSTKLVVTYYLFINPNIVIMS